VTWAIPQRFNIARACCDRWADGSGRLALIHAGATTERWTFDALHDQVCRLANVLLVRGIMPGDRVGVLLPQVPEAAVVHLAIYRIGAIAVPLFQLFGPDALGYRLADCAASLVITDAVGAAKLDAAIPTLRTDDFSTLLARAASQHVCADTAADDPAIIIYTSGTTGAPKGALHAHRVLLGHLPGVETPHEGFPQTGDLFWTPADWAWIGGLLDVLLPSLFHGVPVLARRLPKFDPAEAFALMAQHGVRNAFIPPTALRMLRAAPVPGGVALRTIGSGGETLGAELLDWGREALGVEINEFYGQTECNLVVAARAGRYGVRPGWMGRAVPGHDVAIVDEHGTAQRAGDEGIIAIRRPDPVMFLGYWNRPEATTAKFAGDWLLTGDRGIADDQGWFRFLGRDDDVITSGGYRIGPGEIEDCLGRHPAVAMAAVIGLPDALRTERVTAIVVLKPGAVADAAELQHFVRDRLAAHAYPREVRFVESLPLTATGKIMRGALRRELTPC